MYIRLGLRTVDINMLLLQLYEYYQERTPEEKCNPTAGIMEDLTHCFGRFGKEKIWADKKFSDGVAPAFPRLPSAICGPSVYSSDNLGGRIFKYGTETNNNHPSVLAMETLSNRKTRYRSDSCSPGAYHQSNFATMTLMRSPCTTML